MRYQNILRCIAIAMLLGSIHVQLHGQTLSRPATENAQPGARRQGFFDYVLGKINPQDKDYGAGLESARNAVVENSIDDLYFWSNVVSLILLTATAGVIFLQWRAMDKRELIAATLIAQLWNGRVSDRIEIERRTEQFNQLVELHNCEVEKSLSRKSLPPEPEPETKVARGMVDLHAATPEPVNGETNSNGISDVSMAGLQQEALLLRRQNEAFRNREQNLKERLNQATVLLDQERRKNATLKGA